MIGAFMGLIVAGVLTAMGLPTLSILIIALIIAVLYSAAYGYTVEKIAYKPLRGAPRLASNRSGHRRNRQHPAWSGCAQP